LKKSESLALFNERYVRYRVKEKILQAEDFILQHKEELAAEFVDSFQNYCRKIKTMQLSGDIGNVRYINYAMLRTSILIHKPQYRIDVYNKDWYYDSSQKECLGEYDGGRVFDYLEQIQLELEALRRENYFHQISIVDIERIKIREAHIFNQLMINMARYALYQRGPGHEFVELAKEEVVEVRMGEYYDVSEVIYKEDKREKDPEEVKDWLEDKLENKYVADVFKNLDLSAGNYKNADFRLVDFSGSNLTESNMKGAWLIKARLRKCLMVNANLAKAIIYDADFNGADLRHAVFDAAQGNRGMAQTMNTRIYSLWGVDFSEANLEQASFRKAKLQGANFRGAHFAETNFDGADLSNAIFQRSALKVLDLTEEQVQAVNWVD
jgi:hypothetical protein